MKVKLLHGLLKSLKYLILDVFKIVFEYTP